MTVTVHGTFHPLTVCWRKTGRSGKERQDRRTGGILKGFFFTDRFVFVCAPPRPPART